MSLAEFAKHMRVSPRTMANLRKEMTEGVHFHRSGAKLTRIVVHVEEATALLKNRRSPFVARDVDHIAIDEVTRRRAKVALKAARRR